MRILMCDGETGGLDCTKHSLMSWGMLVGDLESGEILETYESYIKLPSVDDYVCHPKALEVNQLTPELCFNEGNTPDVVRDKMLDMYIQHGCTKIGGHNWPFDEGFACAALFDGMTRAEFQRTFTYHVIDTLPILRLIEGHKNLAKGVRLEHAAKTLKISASDITKGRAHDALTDIVVTFRLAVILRNALNSLDLKSFNELSN